MQTEFKDAKLAIKYALMGRAVLTLQSQASGKHFTYKVTKAKELYWVSILTAGDVYQTIGALVPRAAGEWWFNPKAERRGTMGVLAFNYFWEAATAKGRLGKSLRVMHEGRCGCCGRALTSPESLERGIGPFCAASERDQAA